MHYYQFHIGDYISGTAHLDELEDLAYRRLIDLYYSSEAPLTNDMKALSKSIRMRTHCERIADVLQEFFTLEDGYWHHERIDAEIFKYHEKSEKAAKSARVRWRKHKAKQKVKEPCERSANAVETQCEGNANHKPLTNNHKPLTKLKDIGASAPKFNFKQACLDLGVDKQVLDDWLVTRKKKRSSNTQTSLTMVVNQAELAGIHPAEAIKVAAENNWSSFKAEWYQNSVSQSGQLGKQTLLEHNQQAAREFLSEN
jgi:uncharacterized protein YdaU (DUF1376 family)